MKLSEIIAAERRQQGWSLRDLAVRADINFTSLHHIETGYVQEPSFRSIVRISRALGLPLKKLAETQ